MENTVTMIICFVIQRCFICRPSYFTMSEDAGIQPRTVATLVLSVRRFKKVHLRKVMPKIPTVLGLRQIFNSEISFLAKTFFGCTYCLTMIAHKQ